MINTVKDYEKLSEQYNKLLEERNSLIDDLPWYKAKVSRLEEIRGMKESALKGANNKIKTLERENEEIKESHIKHITNIENYYKDRVQKLKEKKWRATRSY